MPVARKPRLGAILVTGDDELWPEVGQHLSGELTARQLDSIDELIATVPPGETGVLLWDARATANSIAALPRIQGHSARFAIIVLDAADTARAWASALKERQIVALVELPLDTDALTSAIAAATEEARVRVCLLGENTAGAPAPAPPRPQRPVALILAALAAVLVIAGAAFFLLRRQDEPRPASHPASKVDTAPAPPHGAGPDEQGQTLIEKAQQAMLDRHFIDPSDGSALSLYREALQRNPADGEARQGIARVAEILFARVKSSLDERKLDAALQFLETARSIDPGDPRLTDLDARIAGLRAEIGPAQIQAAINAQSFDRALQLIDEASRAKLLSQPKLILLRDEVRQRRLDSEAARVAASNALRLQQDRLLKPAHDTAPVHGQTRDKPEPPPYADLVRARLSTGSVLEPENDNALFYLIALRGADPQNSGLASLTASVQSLILERARGALDAGQLDKAEALVKQAGSVGVSGDVTALTDRLLQAKLALASKDNGPPLVAESVLTRRNRLSLTYPPRAEALNLEGWVELSYAVALDGSVSQTTVLRSSPTGVFEAAAKQAIAHLRYKPYLLDGRAVAVTTKLRVTFRVQ